VIGKGRGAGLDLHITMLTLSLILTLTLQPYPYPTDPNHCNKNVVKTGTGCGQMNGGRTDKQIERQTYEQIKSSQYSY